MKRVVATLTVLVVALQGATVHAQESKPLRPLVVAVYPWRPDSSLLQAQAAKVIIFVHDVTGPGTGLRGARIFVTDDGIVPAGYSTAVAMTDSAGRAELRSVPAGTRYVLIRALAYESALIPLSGVPGCTVYVEAYLRLLPFCTANCPETPTRATVTSCRRDR